MPKRPNENASVKIPDDESICRYKIAIGNKHPSLTDVWMTMDGLKLYLQQSPQSVVQNRFYNGWTHDHYVSNVLGFCPAGTIIVACINVPGCIHDSIVAEWGNIYKQLQDVFDRTGGKYTVDSAFCRKNNSFLIKSSQAMPGSAEEIVVNEDQQNGE